MFQLKRSFSPARAFGWMSRASCVCLLTRPMRAALVFRVEVVGVGRIGEHPEAVAAVHVFPAAVGDAAGVGGIADPAAVVLQAAVDVVRVLRRRRSRGRTARSAGSRPSTSGCRRRSSATGRRRRRAITCFGFFGLTQTSWMSPCMPSKPPTTLKLRPRVLGQDQVAVVLEHAVGVGRVDRHAREIERAPHHPLAAVARLPGRAAVGADVERALRSTRRTRRRASNRSARR